MSSGRESTRSSAPLVEVVLPEPRTHLWIRALYVRRYQCSRAKNRENGRVVNVHTLVAVGVNTDGYREILGLDVTSVEDGAGSLSFFRGPVARGLSRVQLVTPLHIVL